MCWWSGGGCVGGAVEDVLVDVCWVERWRVCWVERCVGGEVEDDDDLFHVYYQSARESGILVISILSVSCVVAFL